MPFVAWLLTVAASAGPLRAQDRPGSSPALTVQVRGHALRARLDGRLTVVPLDSIVDAAAIESIAVKDVAMRGPVTYALLTLSGPSRGPGGAMGYCGAGTEEYVVWLRLQSGRRAASVWHRAASCFHDHDEAAWREAADTVTATWWTPEGRQRLVYLRSAPERAPVVAPAPE